jgi:hypothetical protein
MPCLLVLSAVLFQWKNSVFLSQQISKQCFSACLFSEDICRKFFSFSPNDLELQQISKQCFSACLFSEDICRKFFFPFLRMTWNFCAA